MAPSSQTRDDSVFEPLISGFLLNNDYIGRPVDIEIMKDGSLLVSDDYNGAIYRLTYGTPQVSTR
jgi:glucose/arabinose dehydrogenase